MINGKLLSINPQQKNIINMQTIHLDSNERFSQENIEKLIKLKKLNFSDFQPNLQNSDFDINTNKMNITYSFLPDKTKIIASKVCVEEQDVIEGHSVAIIENIQNHDINKSVPEPYINTKNIETNDMQAQTVIQRPDRQIDYGNK